LSLSEALRAERVDQLVWAVCYESKVHKYAFFLQRKSDVVLFFGVREAASGL